MAKMPRLLRRGPVIDEAEFELTRQRTLERLERMRGGPDASTDIDTTIEDAGPDPIGDRASDDLVAVRDVASPASVEDEVAARAGEPVAPGEGDDGAFRRDVINHGAISLPEHAVNVMAEPGDFDPEPGQVMPGEAAEPLSEPVDGDAEPAIAVVETSSNGNGHHAADVFESGTLVLVRPEEEAGPATERRHGARRDSHTSRAPSARNGSGTAKRGPVPSGKPRAAAAGPPPASCPYCALALVPAPEASRRCVRCRQRIIVRRIDGRAVYLTEAAVLVFESERRRVANTGRWTRDRERWMRLAAAAGASSGRLKRLGAAPLSDDNVTAVRSLYLATVERTFRAAKRDRRWQDSARIRRDHALALYRAAGSPIPPADDVLELYREAAMADLRGIAEFRRDAALVAAKCCDACQADDGRSFRIVRELKTTRLPHAGCPRGLCGCRWDLAERDRSLVARYLRKRTPG